MNFNNIYIGLILVNILPNVTSHPVPQSVCLISTCVTGNCGFDFHNFHLTTAVISFELLLVISHKQLEVLKHPVLTSCVRLSITNCTFNSRDY